MQYLLKDLHNNVTVVMTDGGHVRGLVQVPNPRLAVYYYSASSLINYITGV